MRVEPEHLYVILPGAYLTASGGARLPFDVLLRSLALEYEDRVACVVLSGTGTDGSAGLRAVKATSGYGVAQEPKCVPSSPMRHIEGSCLRRVLVSSQ